eukprot:GHUV01055900.1.p2 GENE.GHUV01055900.1~~GHUV01055900.1.p2  ORF type:complete len:117 (-),score=5.46 GHUV01055900.1:163-513(-)
MCPALQLNRVWYCCGMLWHRQLYQHSNLCSRLLIELLCYCQVQALRAVEPYLNLEKLYVMGTNCVDNGPRQGLEKFLNAASDSPGVLERGCGFRPWGVPFIRSQAIVAMPGVLVRH